MIKISFWINQSRNTKNLRKEFQDQKQNLSLIFELVIDTFDF